MAQHGPDDHDDDDDNHDDNHHHHHHHHVGFTTGHYCLACTNWNNLRCGRPPHAERGESSHIFGPFKYHFWLLLYLLWLCGSKLKPWVPIRPWCTRTCSTGAQWPHHGDMQAFVLPTLTSSLQGLLGTREQAARDAPGPTFRCQQPQNRWPERAHHHRNQEHPVVFATRVCVVLGLNLWENTIQAYFANLVTLFSGGLQKLFKIQLAVVQNTSVCGCECLHTQTPKPTGVLEWRCHRCKDRNQSEYHIFPIFSPHLGEASSCLAFWLLLQARTSRSGVVDKSCGHDGAVIGANAEMFKHDGERMAIRHLCVVFVQVLKFNF